MLTVVFAVSVAFIVVVAAVAFGGIIITLFTRIKEMDQVLDLNPRPQLSTFLVIPLIPILRGDLLKKELAAQSVFTLVTVDIG
jgi:hypothetical protein